MAGSKVISVLSFFFFHSKKWKRAASLSNLCCNSVWLSKPAISWACCFCTTNCFHSQSWGETCHPRRGHKSDVLSARIFSPWWEHRHTGGWHLIRVNSLSPQKTSLWCCRPSLVWTRLPSGPYKVVPMFSYHGHLWSYLHPHLRTDCLLPHTANISISGHQVQIISLLFHQKAVKNAAFLLSTCSNSWRIDKALVWWFILIVEPWFPSHRDLCGLCMHAV